MNRVRHIRARGIVSTLALFLGAIACSSCVSFNWERTIAFEPVSADGVESLRVGQSDVSEVLAKLGAPIYVWEGMNQETVFAYGSLNERNLGFRVSVPVFDNMSASLSYDDAASKLRGYVLVFDANDKLRIVRAGLLRELSKLVRARPAVVE
jgi:hypothetical protein